MTTTENTIDILSDLIEINNDRVAGFEKVLADIDDSNVDLKTLFQKYATQSRAFSQELTALSAQRGGEAETGKSASGTLHRVWIDVKSIFGGSDRKSILNEAERGEDAIKHAYETALNEGGLSGEVLKKVTEQSREIHQAHNSIRALRDASTL